MIIMNNPFVVFLILACLLAFIDAFEYTVEVGTATGENLFFPRTTHVSTGDTIRFFWFGGNHSIIESDARASCTKSTKPKAFFAPATDVFGTEYVVDIQEENGERWFYCGVGRHCENGMYGIIYIGQSTDDTITSSGKNPSYGSPGYTPKSTKSFGIISIIGSLLAAIGILFGIIFFLRWVRRRRNLQNVQTYTQTYTQTRVENVAVIVPNHEAYNQGPVVGNVMPNNGTNHVVDNVMMPNNAINNYEHVIDNVPNHEINNHGQVLDEAPNNEVHHHGRE